MSDPTNRRRLRRIGVLTLTLGALAAVVVWSPPGGSLAGTTPAHLDDAIGLNRNGLGEIGYVASRGQRHRVFTYRATGFDQETGPIWFVMHGTDRNAEDYRNWAAPAAERVRALLVVIEFARWAYPSGCDYTLGVANVGNADADALPDGRWREPDGYVYAEIEHVFDLIRESIGGRQEGYYLFGHSAGAQFVHRLLTFLPQHRVIAAVAANAGWYTLPLRTGGKDTIMPYGLDATPVTEEMRRRLFASHLAILLGELDVSRTKEDPNLRDTSEAMAQGSNRLERGQRYFRIARDEAERLGAPFNWRLAVVDHARHKANEMLSSAIPFLFGDGALCESDAGVPNIKILEVLSDPPAGPAGDLNRDGKRVGIEDEYVRLVNRGETEACLDGWTLGDREEERRHVFPLGTVLQPGESLIVFGGGLPTGDFTSQVQWARSGRLSLSNGGDEITLRNRVGSMVDSKSW